MDGKEGIVVGLDSSTTGTKVMAFDARGRIKVLEQEPVPLFSPKPNYYEQDPEDWWNSARKALQKLTRKVDPGRILAVAISNQRETFTVLDRNGEPLRPAIIWLDERCKYEVKAFAKKVGERRIHEITGKPVDYAPVVYRLAWMKKHEPNLFRKINMVCDVHTFLVWKLTGSFKTSVASADPLGIFDMKAGMWSGQVMKALGISGSQLPETFSPGAILGSVSRAASKSTGLNTNTLVIAGGGDGQAAGLGSNILSSQKAYLNLGTAVVAGVYSPRYRASRAFRTMYSCSGSGYYFECSLRAGTFAIDWFIRNILRANTSSKKDIYISLEKEARNVPAGCGGLVFLPYLCGVMNPYWDIDARGAFIGLSSSHTWGYMYRAVLEGIAFEQLFALNALQNETGARVKEFTVIGGGAASKLWLEIIAAVTGRKIRIPGNTEASGLGAAIAAGVGIGWYGDFKTAADKMTRPGRIILPDPRNGSIYRRIYGTYKGIYPALRKKS